MLLILTPSPDQCLEPSSDLLHLRSLLCCLFSSHHTRAMGPFSCVSKMIPNCFLNTLANSVLTSRLPKLKNSNWGAVLTIPSPSGSSVSQGESFNSPTHRPSQSGLHYLASLISSHSPSPRSAMVTKGLCVFCFPFFFKHTN